MKVIFFRFRLGRGMSWSLFVDRLRLWLGFVIFSLFFFYCLLSFFLRLVLGFRGALVLVSVLVSGS